MKAKPKANFYVLTNLLTLSNTLAEEFFKPLRYRCSIMMFYSRETDKVFPNKAE